MKSKLTKIFLMALTLSLFAASSVKAEKVCKTYENYYFFIAINTKNYLNQHEGENFNFTTFDYFPQPDVAINSTDKTKSRSVCIKKTDGNDNRCEGQTYVKDLDWYFEKYALVSNSSTTVNVVSPRGNSISKIYTETDGNVIRNYYTHGNWFKIDENGKVSGQLNGVDNILSDKSALINASTLPIKSEIAANSIAMDWYSSDDFIKGTIERNLTLPTEKIANTQDNNPDYPTFYGVVWSEGGNAIDSWLLPQLGFITYEVCAEGEGYKAQIDYVYENGNQAATSYTEDKLPNAYENNVQSPNIDGCTPDKATVKVIIDENEPKDFYAKVVYTCKKETPKSDEPKNNKSGQSIAEGPITGDALIYIAWAMGLATIAFVVYFYRKERKNNN